MNIKLLTEHSEFLSQKEAAQACLSLYSSKCNIVGNHMMWLIKCCLLNYHITGHVRLLIFESSCFIEFMIQVEEKR